MPKAHDLTGDLRRLRHMDAPPQVARATDLRKGYRRFATDWGSVIGWSFGAALFLMQFAVLAWIAL